MDAFRKKLDQILEMFSTSNTEDYLTDFDKQKVNIMFSMMPSEVTQKPSISPVRMIDDSFIEKDVICLAKELEFLKNKLSQ